MIATDFYLDGLYASDFDLIIASVNGGNSDDVSGGGVEYSVAKTPDNDEFKYYTHQWNEPLVWNLTLVKNPCASNNYYFTYEECRQITKWLQSTGKYRWIHFEEEGYEDLFYNVYINVSVNQVAGKTVGFNLVITSNCGYGFSDERVIKKTVNENADLDLLIDSDIKTYIYPYIEFECISPQLSDEYFYIYNESDVEQNALNGKDSKIDVPIFDTDKCIMDSKNSIFYITDDNNFVKQSTFFNYYFIRLLDGHNLIKTTSSFDVNLTIKYREPRMVII